MPGYVHLWQTGKNRVIRGRRPGEPRMAKTGNHKTPQAAHTRGPRKAVDYFLNPRRLMIC